MCNEKNDGYVALTIAFLAALALIAGFSFGYFVRGYQQPRMTKGEILEYQTRVVDRMARIAKVSAEQGILCGRCHGED